jgi:hypothetical protein
METPKPMRSLLELLPQNMMFMFGCLREGHVNIDTAENKVNISEFSYDPNLVNYHLDQLNQYESDYLADLRIDNPDATIPANEQALFNAVRTIYTDMKVFL